MEIVWENPWLAEESVGSVVGESVGGSVVGESVGSVVGESVVVTVVGESVVTVVGESVGESVVGWRECGIRG